MTSSPATTARKTFRLVFVFNIISGPSLLLQMEGLRNHNFIIPRPKQKNKGNFDEKARKSLTEHQLTSCPEPAGMSLRDDQLQEFRVEA